MISRRTVLAGLAANAAAKTKPTILVRSGWQTVNIGDIAHTPGLLAVLEKNVPGAELILWPAELDRGAEPMLMRRFPRLRIVKSLLDAGGNPASAELREAFSASDLLVHGSAASVTSQPQMEAWRKLTGKPYGFFGVGFTLQGEAAGAALSPALRSLLSASAFLFTRETASLRNLKRAEIAGPEVGFAPDGTFSMDILDESRGLQFLRENGLEPGKFICLIPRLRYTPYHKIRKVTWSDEEIRRRTEVNDRHAEPDHAKLREAILAWVRQTGGRALLCPEMTYELDIIDPLLFDPLPDDVKKNVVRRKSYWLPDEAASVYKRAAAVVSCECHSPILAAVSGTPCIYVHQPEDGIKGQMWKDLGLGDWYFDIEETSGSAIAARVLEIHAKPGESKRKVNAAVAQARKLQSDRMTFVRRRVLQA